MARLSMSSPFVAAALSARFYAPVVHLFGEDDFALEGGVDCRSIRDEPDLYTSILGRLQIEAKCQEFEDLYDALRPLGGLITITLVNVDALPRHVLCLLARLHLTLHQCKLITTCRFLPWECLAEQPIAVNLPISSHVHTKDDPLAALAHTIMRPMVGTSAQLTCFLSKVASDNRDPRKALLSGQFNDLVSMQSELDANLPRLSPTATYLLVAAFIASFNPSGHDLVLFSSAKDGRRRRLQQNSGSKKLAATNVLPHPFHINRLLAIFLCIIPDEWAAPAESAVLRHVHTLCAHRLLMQAANSKADRHRFRANIGYDAMKRVYCAPIRFQLDMYLK